MREIIWQGRERVIRDVPLPSVTRRQARLVLGETACAAIDALAADPEIPWAMRESIQSATVWYRTAPEIDELAWVLGLEAEQIDALFRAAAEVP